MVIRGDARHVPLRDKSVQCVVTSPPYWGLRDYGTGAWEGGNADCGHSVPATGSTSNKGNNGKLGTPFREICGLCGAERRDRQIGLEATPDEYVATMVGVFREVWRVLRDDGVCWINLGDSYWNGGAEKRDGGHGFVDGGKPKLELAKGMLLQRKSSTAWGLKPKDLCGMPWRVAFALQADGWYLRSDIIWAKPNPMPESVTDRPTRSHEYLFLLSKRPTYFYDADAIRERAVEGDDLGLLRGRGAGPQDGVAWHAPSILKRQLDGVDSRTAGNGHRNKRDVWTVNSEPTPESHFATFPQKLIEPCILAGTSEKGCCADCGALRVRVVEKEQPPESLRNRGNGSKMDFHARQTGSGQKLQDWYDEHPSQTTGWRPSCECTRPLSGGAHRAVAPSVPCVVFDPFLGSGTVGKVCERLGRRWVGLELSEPYIEIAKKRTAQLGLAL